MADAPNTSALITVSAAGTPVALASTDIKCTRLWIQPLKALGASTAADTQNAGVIYLMNSATAKGAASSNIIARIPPAQTTLPLEALVPLGFNLADMYLDAQTSGDGALISYV